MKHKTFFPIKNDHSVVNGMHNSNVTIIMIMNTILYRWGCQANFYQNCHIYYQMTNLKTSKIPIKDKILWMKSWIAVCHIWWTTSNVFKWQKLLYVYTVYPIGSDKLNIMHFWGVKYIMMQIKSLFNLHVYFQRKGVKKQNYKKVIWSCETCSKFTSCTINHR